MAHQHPSVGEDAARRLLLSLGSAMISSGYPVYETEDEVRRVAYKLGYHNNQVSATPTSVVVALNLGGPTAMATIRSQLRLDQSVEVNNIRRDLIAGNIGIGPALARLHQISQLKPRYGLLGSLSGWMFIALGICLILQPAWPSVAFTAIFSIVVWGLAKLSSSQHILTTLLPVVASFIVSAAAFYAYNMGWIEGPLRTLICPFAVLLPGATIATGMAELAAGMMVAGSARAFYGMVQLLLFGAGTIGAVLLLKPGWQAMTNQRVSELGAVATVIGLLGLAIGLALSESLPWRQAPFALVLLVLTYGAQFFGNSIDGAAVGAFCGAAMAGFGSAALEATLPSISRLVVFLPSFWLLVPGTVGVMGVAQLGTEGTGPLTTMVGVVNVVISIAIGLLIGTALARPLSRIGRQIRRHKLSRTQTLTPEPPVPVDDQLPEIPLL